MSFRLLTEPTHQPKALKSTGAGYAIFVLHLAPARLSGRNVCPHSTAGCRTACLNMAGRGPTAQSARRRRTSLFFSDRTSFMSDLYWDIEAAQRWAQRRSLTPAIRLNGTSDLTWENESTGAIFTDFSHVQFYDYTKNPRRRPPPNYHLTFSRSERNDWRQALPHMNVAVVFADTIPTVWNGIPVIDGTKDDCRFLDPPGVIVGLHALGPARHDQSGFVVAS